MTLQSDLIAARALIDTPEKWCKHRFHDEGGAACAVGALDAIPGADGRRSDALKYLRLFIPKDFYSVALMDFNDDAKTTHADILALFDRAIKAAS